MKTGPQKGTRVGTDERSFADKASEAWKVVPDWIFELTQLADAKGLKGAAEAIGASTSLVSYVIRNDYSGDIGRVEELVRGALMGATVWCQGVGDDIARHTCLDWQKKPFAATSPDRTRMYRACRNNCPNFRQPVVRSAGAPAQGVDDVQQ